MEYDIAVPSSERIQQDILYLKDWISKQPHLPKIDDDDWLETFLWQCKFSLEKTKFKLENYYSLRTKYPEILKNRDPTSPDLLKSMQAIKFAMSDRLTEDNARILYCKYEEDAHAYEVEPFSKRLFMALDVLLLNKERQAHLVTITDYQNARYLHILKMMSGLNKVAEISSGAYTERIKSVHLINVPPFVEKSVEVIKKFFPKKLAERFHVHTSTNKLIDTLDEDVLCSDFGGKGPSLDELQDYTQNEFSKHRKWFLEQDEICSNELLRRKDDHELEELKGSFRKLEVD